MKAPVFIKNTINWLWGDYDMDDEYPHPNVNIVAEGSPLDLAYQKHNAPARCTVVGEAGDEVDVVFDQITDLITCLQAAHTELLRRERIRSNKEIT